MTRIISHFKQIDLHYKYVYIQQYPDIKLHCKTKQAKLLGYRHQTKHRYKKKKTSTCIERKQGEVQSYI